MRNWSGSLRTRVPFASKREGGPRPVAWYRNILNQMEEISGIAGPRCGGKAPDTGRISLDSGAIETRRLKEKKI